MHRVLENHVSSGVREGIVTVTWESAVFSLLTDLCGRSTSGVSGYLQYNSEPFSEQFKANNQMFLAPC